MAMWDVAFAGVGGTALGGVVASLAVLFVQERREDARGPRREVEAARAVARDAAARSIFRCTTEIKRGLHHIRNGDSYEDSVLEHAQEMRRLSRAHVPLLGTGVQEAAMRFTDTLVTELPQITNGAEPSDTLDAQATFLAGAIEGAAPGWTLED